MIIKCPVCNGKKQYFGFGGMMKSCVACKAVGYIEEKEPEKENFSLDEIKESEKIDDNCVKIELAKRRGRPPRSSL